MVCVPTASAVWSSKTPKLFSLKDPLAVPAPLKESVRVTVPVGTDPDTVGEHGVVTTC